MKFSDMKLLIESAEVIEKIFPQVSPDFQESYRKALVEILNNDCVKQTPTMAIKLLLKEYPNGLLISEIVNKTRGKFSTSSKNPDKVIYNSVHQLKTQGVLRKENEFYQLIE
jgi:hypothetical protein